MLDSTNRPKGMQRRLARKRLNAQAQNQSQTQPDAPRRRDRAASGKRQPRPSQPAEGKPRTAPAARPTSERRGAGEGGGGPNPTGSARMRRGPAHPQATHGMAMGGDLRQVAPGQMAPGQVAPRQVAPGQVAPGRRRPPNRSDSQHQPGSQRPRLKVPLPMGRKAKSEQAGRRRTSPLIHLFRLLILGVGVGAIAGTVLSMTNPSMRNPSANQVTDPIAQQASTVNRPGVPGTLATISSVRMGREMTDLVAKVTPLTRDLTDLVPGVFLMDFDNGNYLSFNGSTAFSSASMIKLPILIAFFQDVDAGKIKLDEMLSIQQADVAEGSGDMQYSNVGTQFTALDTATNMIITSDNTATNMIIRRLGGSEVLNQRFRQWGLQQTLLRKPLPDLEGLNTTSPKELVSLLALLNDGKLLSMKSRDRTFDIMRRTVTDTLLPSVLSPGSTVAHKTGDIGSLVGDVGVVDLPSGRRYAVAIMVKRPHNDGRAQDLIRQIAAVIYEHFGGQPMVAPSPVASPPAQVAPQTTAPGVPGMAQPGLPAPAGTAPAGSAPAASSPGAVAPAPGAPLAPATAPAPGAPTAPLTAPLAPAAPVAPVPEALPADESSAPQPVDQAPPQEPPADQETAP